MRIGELFKQKPCVFALEVFPPKRGVPVETVFGALERLGAVPADYISVTYGAGGTGERAYTAEIARYLKQRRGVEPLPHLTCFGSARGDIARELSALEAAGAENVLALRGDRLPGVGGGCDYRYASDLVADIAARSGFYIAGACYPEGHPESISAAADLDALRRKAAAGAGHFVSQLFFDNGKFYRFLNRLRKAGLPEPVEAGVMPMVRAEQVRRILALSSASLPAGFTKLMARYESDPAGFYDAGIAYAVEQCRDLIEGGADGIHLYAMNRPSVAKRVYDGIADLLT